MNTLKAIIFFLLSSSMLMANTGVNVFIDNNCSYPIQVKLDGKNKAVIQANEYSHLGYYSTYITKLLTFSFTHNHNKNDIGSVKLIINNNLTSNNYQIVNRTGLISTDNKSKAWHSWYGTPNITITSCPIRYNNSESSIFNNVKRVIVKCTPCLDSNFTF